MYEVGYKLKFLLYISIKINKSIGCYKIRSWIQSFKDSSKIENFSAAITIAENSVLSVVRFIIYIYKDNLGPISHARRAQNAHNLHECIMRTPPLRFEKVSGGETNAFFSSSFYFLSTNNGNPFSDILLIPVI